MEITYTVCPANLEITQDEVFELAKLIEESLRQKFPDDEIFIDVSDPGIEGATTGIEVSGAESHERAEYAQFYAEAVITELINAQP